ncbi:hypothetical protein LSAT2_015631, partial [Lamellibrachia satsuma]
GGRESKTDGHRRQSQSGGRESKTDGHRRQTQSGGRESKTDGHRRQTQSGGRSLDLPMCRYRIEPTSVSAVNKLTTVDGLTTGFVSVHNCCYLSERSSDTAASCQQHNRSLPKYVFTYVSFEKTWGVNASSRLPTLHETCACPLA